MRTLHLRHLLALALLPAAGCAAAADARCLSEMQAQRDRVDREAVARRPGSDPAAQQAWSAWLHAQMEEVGKRHEACEKAARPAPGSPARQAEIAQFETCLAAASRDLDAIQKRYAGRTLSTAEQTAQRADEQRVLDARMACRAPAR